MRHGLLRVLTAALAGAALCVAVPLSAQAKGATGGHLLQQDCIDEPVFNSTACIYEANPGADETVVLVHGLNGQARRDWGGQIPELAKHYHVLTFDLPGFGDSGKEADSYSPERYARFIRFVTQRYTRRPFHLVGHSMGGAIVLRYSGAYPQDVKRLVLVDVAGVLHRMAYARQLASAWLEDNAGNDGRAGGFFDRMVYKFITKVEGISGIGNDYMARKMLEEEFIDPDPAMIAAYTLANEDLGDALRQITMPTLMIWGERDRVAPLRTARALQARLPQARLVILPTLGHSPMREAADIFNAKLLPFLNDIEAELPENNGEQAAPLRSETDITCRNQRAQVYEGRFERLTLNGCREIIIRNAHIDNLFVSESVVSIENSSIGTAKGTGLVAVGAELTLTATTISGEVAIHASRSRLDLAAVTLKGAKTAVTGDRGSSLIFSISRVESVDRERGIHGYYEVDRNNSL
jgi:pimeloyl-ACP methyl ester carboxylesterase